MVLLGIWDSELLTAMAPCPSTRPEQRGIAATLPAASNLLGWEKKSSSQGLSLGLPKRNYWVRANKAPNLVRTIISYKLSLEQPDLITQPTSIHTVTVPLVRHRSITSHTEAAGWLCSISRALLRTYLRNLFRSPCFMYSKTMMSGSPSPHTP